MNYIKTAPVKARPNFLTMENSTFRKQASNTWILFTRVFKEASSNLVLFLFVWLA